MASCTSVPRQNILSVHLSLPAFTPYDQTFGGICSTGRKQKVGTSSAFQVKKHLHLRCYTRILRSQRSIPLHPEDTDRGYGVLLKIHRQGNFEVRGTMLPSFILWAINDVLVIRKIALLSESRKMAPATCSVFLKVMRQVIGVIVSLDYRIIMLVSGIRIHATISD